MKPDTIVITAPAGTKASWVRQSQREGLKLSEWVIRNIKVSMSMQAQIRVVIPAEVSFADLNLARDPATGELSFDWLPLENICKASGIDIQIFRGQSEKNVAGVLSIWYARHRSAGGASDLVMDELIGESAIEGAHGHGFSYRAGRS